MKTDDKTCLCHHAGIDNRTEAIKSAGRKTISRYIEFLKMIMPAIAFTLIPKCPVCLAGYVALSTGIGLSITTATYMRIVLIIVCILSLIYFVVKHVRRFIFNE
jgi:hypothetical protein